MLNIEFYTVEIISLNSVKLKIDKLWNLNIT